MSKEKTAETKPAAEAVELTDAREAFRKDPSPANRDRYGAAKTAARALGVFQPNPTPFD